jgi:hypothetical protein
MLECNEADGRKMAHADQPTNSVVITSSMRFRIHAREIDSQHMRSASSRGDETEPADGADGSYINKLNTAADDGSTENPFALAPLVNDLQTGKPPKPGSRQDSDLVHIRESGAACRLNYPGFWDSTTGSRIQQSALTTARFGTVVTARL